MRGTVLLWVGVMLACLGVVLSLPATGSEVPSALTGADGGRVVANWGNAPQQPDDSHPLMPSEEVRETDKAPVNAYLMTMLMLACSLGASVLRMLLTNARRQGAICSWIGDDRWWLAVAHEDPSFLGVFRL
jgi:hypothetical protein